MATYGGDLSLEHFLVLESRAVPFDAAHAIGNVAFALVAGPAMIRMLLRFRERFEWRAARPRAGAGGARLLLAPGAGDRRLPAERRRGRHRQGGELAGLGPERRRRLRRLRRRGLEHRRPPPGRCSGWRRRAATRSTSRRGGKTPVDYLRSHAGDLSSSGDFARTILALEGAGVDPRSFGGRNLVSRAAQPPRATTAPTRAGPGRTAFAIARPARRRRHRRPRQVAVLAGRRPERRRRLGRHAGRAEQRRRHRRRDAGAARARRPPKQGLSYLRKHQRANGGFALGGGGAVNSQSTAWAVQGMIAVGGRPGLGQRRRPQRPRLPRRPARQATATSATRVAATRPRSGSPARSWSPPPARTSRSPPPPRAPKPAATPVPSPRRKPCRRSPIPGVTAAGDAGAADRRAAERRRRLGRRLRARRAADPGIRGSPPPIGGSRRDPAAGLARRRRPDGLVEATPASDVGASPDDPASPWIPIGIGLGVGLLALARAARPRPALRLVAAGPASDGGYVLSMSAERAGAMDVETAIRTRRTHKAFAPEPLPREELDELLELARWAPNHHLTAPWRFRVVGPEALERLKQAAGPEGAAKLDRAPTLIVVSSRARAATRSRTRRTCTRPPSPPTSSCSPPTPAASPATGARPALLRTRRGPRRRRPARRASASSASSTSATRARSRRRRSARPPSRPPIYLD